MEPRKADLFRSLHHAPKPLVLPNAWDAASARIFEEMGFAAVATTSAGVANSLGYPDGERIPRDEMLAVVRRIAEAVQVPVTADVEAGYGERPEAVAETVRGVIAAGAVGINLEDAWDRNGRRALADLRVQVERIQAAREAANAAGVPIVVNARTDAYMLPDAIPESGRFDEAVRRLNAYLEAGADCAFPPLLRDPQAIGALVRAIHGPVNIFGGPGAPTVPELQKLGVARVSVGAWFMRVAMSAARRAAAEYLESGTYASSQEDALTSAEMNRLFQRAAGAK